MQKSTEASLGSQYKFFEGIWRNCGQQLFFEKKQKLIQPFFENIYQYFQAYFQKMPKKVKSVLLIAGMCGGITFFVFLTKKIQRKSLEQNQEQQITIIEQQILPEPQYYKYSDISKYEIEDQIEKIIKAFADQDQEWGSVLREMKEFSIKLLESKPKIPLILNQQNFIELKRADAFAFLSLMFFDLTISQEITQHLRHDQCKFNPYQNMAHLRNKTNPFIQEKFKCIQNYFKIFCKFQKDLSDQKIIISKMKLKSKNTFEKWMSSEAPLAKIEFTNNSMFDYENKTFVDFADPYIGGLVLDGNNCAQEEILMLLHPEAIVASLFFQKLEEDEAIYFENVLRTCNFTGYEKKFKFCNIADYQPRMENILAIDAYNFSHYENQFEEKWVQRELNKAFVGFEGAKNGNRDIVSGKWGCGIFKGNVELKLLIQIAAFSQSLLNNNSQTKLILSLFNDKQSKQLEQRLTEKLSQFKTVGELIKSVNEMSYNYRIQIQ